MNEKLNTTLIHLSIHYTDRYMHATMQKSKTKMKY